MHHRNERLHELHLGAIGADDVFAVGDETAADQRGLATRADETVVMPMPVLERDEASPANACYRFGAGGASLGEQFSETIGAIGLVVARRESLASQGIVTVATGEAVSVPRLVLVRYPTAGDDLVALNASSGKLVLVARGAIDLLLARDEALSPDRVLAHHAAEALLVPLPGLVLHLLRTGTEDLAASIATAGELGVVTIPAVDLVHLATELFVHQGHSAPVAQETGLVPMLILVRQILGIDTDDFVALLAPIREHALVALDAVRVLVPQHVALPGQRLVALPATEVAAVPILAHRLRVLAIFDGVVIVLRAVDLGDRDLGVLIVALPALGRLLHFANLTLGGRVHYTVYVRHRRALIRAFGSARVYRDVAKDIYTASATCGPRGNEERDERKTGDSGTSRGKG